MGLVGRDGPRLTGRDCGRELGRDEGRLRRKAAQSEKGSSMDGSHSAGLDASSLPTSTKSSRPLNTAGDAVSVAVLERYGWYLSALPSSVTRLSRLCRISYTSRVRRPHWTHLGAGPLGKTGLSNAHDSCFLTHRAHGCCPSHCLSVSVSRSRHTLTFRS